MKNKKPLISVNLPTYNGEDTIRAALDSVKAQTYKNYEIVIVDHNSKDKTVEIAKKYTNKIYFDEKKLLNSRKIGLEKSKGEIIIFLSCDQVFEPTMFERAIKAFNEKDYDMLVTEERSHTPVTFVEKMTDLDRKKIQDEFELDPYKSVILPSIYKKELLVRIFKKFTEPVLANVTIHDHAIIYHEAYKLSKKIGLVRNAVYHSEPKTVKELFNHYYSWGKRARAVKGILPKEYDEMFASKMKNRLASLSPLDPVTLRILPIIFIKGLGFRLGSTFG